VQDTAPAPAAADTATTPPPAAGQPEGATPPAPAGQTSDPDANATPWADPDAARAEIQRLRGEAASWRTKLREAEPLAAKYREFEQSQKTEAQKALEAQTAAEQERDDLRAANARLMAAATHNIPADLIDFLGTGTPEEIGKRAELLAARLPATQQTPPPASGGGRPVEALRPGAAPAGAPDDSDPNAWLRRAAGRR
jgi:hypothetical protein